MAFREVCLVGDSIAQGFVDEEGRGWFGRFAQKVVEAYPARFSFHNASQGGDCSIDAYHRLSVEAVQRRGDYLILSVGSNDIVRWVKPDAQLSLAPELSAVTWQWMLGVARKNFRHVLVCGVLPSVEARYPQPGFEDVPYYRFNADLVAYNAMLEAQCARAKVSFLPLFDLFDGCDDLYFDGCHPNAEGHRILADAVHARVQSLGWF